MADAAAGAALGASGCWAEPEAAETAFSAALPTLLGVF